MKKLSASNKKAQQEAAKAQQENAALKAALIITQGRDQANVQGLLVPAPHTKPEPKPKTKSKEHPDQEPAPEKDPESELLESIQLTSKDSTEVCP